MLYAAGGKYSHVLNINTHFPLWNIISTDIILNINKTSRLVRGMAQTEQTPEKPFCFVRAMSHATRHTVTPYPTWWGMLRKLPASPKNPNAWTNVSSLLIRKPLVQQLTNQNATFIVVASAFYVASRSDAYKHLHFVTFPSPLFFTVSYHSRDQMWYSH